LLTFLQNLCIGLSIPYFHTNFKGNDRIQFFNSKDFHGNFSYRRLNPLDFLFSFLQIKGVLKFGENYKTKSYYGAEGVDH